MTRLLLLGGSTRAGATTTAVLRTAETLADADLFDRLAELPAYSPDDDREPLAPAVDGLRARVRAADAVLICTPEYAGGLPGAFKNLLDWTVGDGSHRSMYGKPVAWINASSPVAPTGGADAHESLAKVLGYVGAVVVEAACARVPMTRDAVGADGLVADPDLHAAIADAVRALLAHVTCT